MAKLLFNIHDIALILVATACLMHALAILVHQSHPSQKYLALFLFSTATRAIDTLFYWAVPVKTELLAFSPHIFFVLKTSFLLEPVFLYFFTRSIIYYDQKISRVEYLHFLPSIIFLCSIPLIYQSFGDQLGDSIYDYSVFSNDPLFSGFTIWSRSAYIAYALLSLHILMRHRHKLEETFSNIDGVDAKWLTLLIVGFLCLWVLRGFGHLLTQLGWSWLPDAVGLSSNWLLFILINALVFLSLTRAANVKQQSLHEETTTSTTSENNTKYTEEQIQRLETTMIERKVYLEPNLSLEQLSRITSLPQKQLSAIINRHFNKNYFEFVNLYRVNHAKELLTNQDQRKSMLDIMAESGFNSKSAFNRFFKKFTELTPSQYRAKQTSQQADKNKT